MTKVSFQANYLDYFRGGWPPTKSSSASVRSNPRGGGLHVLLSPIFMASTVLAAHLLAGLYTLVIRVKSDEDCDPRIFLQGLVNLYPSGVVPVDLGNDLGWLVVARIARIYLSLAYAFSLLLVIRRFGPMAGYGGEQANHYGSLYGLSGIRRLGLNRKRGRGYPVWFGPVRLDPRYPCGAICTVCGLYAG